MPSLRWFEQSWSMLRITGFCGSGCFGELATSFESMSLQGRVPSLEHGLIWPGISLFLAFSFSFSSLFLFFSSRVSSCGL